MTRFARIGFSVFVIAGLLVGGAAYMLRGSAAGLVSGEEQPVPTTRVTRGSLEMNVHTTGELRASKSLMLAAPPVGGGTLRLVRLAETGTEVHVGDVVMEFDPTEQQYVIDQSESQLEEADQTIAKMKADREVALAQEQVDLLGARFDLRRAELDALPDKDLIPPNKYQQFQISLEEAKRHLAQVEESSKSKAETNRAQMAVAVEGRLKTKMAADRAKANIDSLIVKATMDGFVVVRDNRDASGGMFFSGMSLPAYRAGDNVYPGRPITDIFDISHMEVKSKIDEQQRVNVAPGQGATLQADALPGVKFTATVKAVSGTAQTDFWGDSAGPLRQFDVTLAIDQSDPRLRPGTSVRLVLAGSKIENVLHVPRQSIFEKNGKPIVYVKTGDHFEPRVVHPTNRTEGRVAIDKADGVDEGTEIALVNPDSIAKAKAKPGAGPGPVSGGSK